MLAESSAAQAREQAQEAPRALSQERAAPVAHAVAVPQYPVGVLRRLLAATDDPLGGTEAQADVVERLGRTRGSGSALPDPLLRRMSEGFGANLSEVRVHDDDAAHHLAADVQSVAFSHGRDIYFSRGSFAPGTEAGQRVIAHELAHVVDPVPSGRSGPLTIGRSDDPAEHRADAAAQEVMGGLRRHTFDDLDAPAAAPGQVRRQREPDSIRRIFGKVKKFAKSLLGKADPVADTETGTDYLDSMSQDDRKTYQRRSRGSGPGENPDYSDPTLFGADPDSWTVTLAVAQEDIDWMRNVNELKETALRELVTSPKKLLGGMDGAQQRVVEKTLLRRGDLDGKTQEEVRELVETFTDSIHDVGHTWVRLSTSVGGKTKEIYSYGMWPQKVSDPAEYQRVYGGYAGPISVGPGEVKHPDIAHEGDATKAYKHYTVKKKDFDKALDLAIARYNNPPPYVLTGYNCTAFAREVVQAAGQSYPGKGILPGIAYTPGNLYWAIMKEWAKSKKGVRTQDTEEDAKAMEALGARAQKFAKAGDDNVRSDYKTTAFQLPPPGTGRRRVTLYEGAVVECYDYPDQKSESNQLELDDDTEFTVIDDEKTIATYGVIPVDLGARIVFFDYPDFLEACEPPREMSQRDEFFAHGLAYYGTFRPPTDKDSPTGTWSVSDLEKKPLPEFADSNANEDWTAVSDRGEIYWVRRDHLAAFRDPKSVSFGDEQDEKSEGGDGASMSSERKRELVAEYLEQFAGLGSISVAAMLDNGNLSYQGLTMSRHMIQELIKEDESFRQVLADALQADMADIRMDFG